MVLRKEWRGEGEGARGSGDLGGAAGVVPRQVSFFIAPLPASAPALSMSCGEG